MQIPDSCHLDHLKKRKKKTHNYLSNQTVGAEPLNLNSQGL